MYSIREASGEDLKQLARVERAAAQLFRDSPYPEFADGPLAADSMRVDDRVWVIAKDTFVAAFAITRSIGDAVHIQEIDVHPDHARQGIGRRLIAHVAEWARTLGRRAITLTTMSDVPWNGPYYARLGFVEIGRDAAGEGLRRILAEEEQAGVPMTRRICMQLSLT